MNLSLSERMKLVLGSAKPETAMSGVAAYPASGSYIDVSGYEVAHIIAHMGTLHASDTPTLEPKCSDANNGTLDRIDATLVHTCDVTNDDGKTLMWSIEVRKLPLDHHFLSLATGGTLTNGSYIDVLFLLENGGQPVTQPSTTSASYNHLG
jgi:hypothetical protein